MTDTPRKSSEEAQQFAQQWARVAEKRAMIYHWLSGLFAQELTDEQFRFYQTGKADEWLSGLAHIGLEHEVKQIKAAIAQWRQSGSAALCLGLS